MRQNKTDDAVWQHRDFRKAPRLTPSPPLFCHHSEEVALRLNGIGYTMHALIEVKVHQINQFPTKK
jgi:hypothetical protein